MTHFYQIYSYLPNADQQASSQAMVIDVQERLGPPTSGTALDAYPPKATDNTNQLWTFEQGPEDYFFIKSALGNDLVMTVPYVGIPQEPGVVLTVTTQKSSGEANQLWKIVPYSTARQPNVIDGLPSSTNYFYIQSPLGWVVDVQGAPKAITAGTALDAFGMKNSGYDNQLWTIGATEFPGKYLRPAVTITSENGILDNPDTLKDIITITWAASGFMPGSGVVITYGFQDADGNYQTNQQSAPIYTCDLAGNCSGQFTFNVALSNHGTLTISANDSYNGLYANYSSPDLYWG